MGAMTGPGLLVKWTGVAVLLCYMALILFAIWKVRGRVGLLRFGLFVPLILGNFIGFSVPGIFEKAVIARVCFVVAGMLYLFGIAILVKAVIQHGRTGLQS